MKQKKKRVGWVTKACIGAFAIYSACTLVNLQLRIADASEEQARLQAELEQQTLVCAELSDAVYGENHEEYIEQVARDSLGYAYPGEQVYVDISSK